MSSEAPARLHVFNPWRSRHQANRLAVEPKNAVRRRHFADLAPHDPPSVAALQQNL
jgi:hypothetical protein